MILKNRIVHYVSENARIIERQWEDARGEKDTQFHPQERKTFLFFKWWKNCEEENMFRNVSGCGDHYLPITYESYKLAERVLFLRGIIYENALVQ